jgi:hypothetical protein
MLRPKNKPSVLLIYLPTLFFIALLLIFTNCGQRAEEDAAVIEKEDFESQYGHKSSPEQFEIAVEMIGEGGKNTDKLLHAFNVATRIINQEFDSLNKDPKSKEYALYIVLECIGKITGEEGVIVEEGSRADKLIQIFKLLVDKEIKVVDKDTWEDVKKNKAIDQAQESLYYPLTVLGKIGPTTDVAYRHDRKDDTIHLISWVILKDNLNKKLKKEMLEILVTPNKEGLKSGINSLDDTQYGKLTPPMLLAREARSTRNNSNDEEGNYNIELFELLLGHPDIKLMDMNKKSSEVKEPEKLDGQPLLSFIIYNCVSKEIKLNGEWIRILKKALNAGDLANHAKEKEIKKYKKDYIEEEKSNINLDFDRSGLYDKTKVQEVKAELEKYANGSAK